MIELTALPYLVQSIIVFLSQLGFMYFRTRNVAYNADKNRFGVFWTGAFVHLCWILAIAIGVTAVVNGVWWMILVSFSAGALGADRGLVKHIKIDNEKRTD